MGLYVCVCVCVYEKKCKGENINTRKKALSSSAAKMTQHIPKTYSKFSNGPHVKVS